MIGGHTFRKLCLRRGVMNRLAHFNLLVLTPVPPFFLNNGSNHFTFFVYIWGRSPCLVDYPQKNSDFGSSNFTIFTMEFCLGRYLILILRRRAQILDLISLRYSQWNSAWVWNAHPFPGTHSSFFIYVRAQVLGTLGRDRVSPLSFSRGRLLVLAPFRTGQVLKDFNWMSFGLP